MNQQEQTQLEQHTKFRFFLLSFGLKGINEYQTLKNSEKLICLQEFKKTLKK